MKSRRSCVYEAVAPSGKRYIGSASDFSTRKSRHLKDLERAKHCNRMLQNAWNKYGAELKWRPLIVCRKSDLLFYEQLCIDNLNPEYNLSPTASSSLGVKHTAEFRAKISAVTKGVKRSALTRAKMSAAFRGLKKPPRTPEHQAKLTAAVTGRVHSAESKAKMSASLVGRIFTPEWRKKISLSKRGKPFAGVPYRRGRKSAVDHRHKFPAGHLINSVDYEVK